MFPFLLKSLKKTSPESKTTIVDSTKSQSDDSSLLTEQTQASHTPTLQTFSDKDSIFDVGSTNDALVSTCPTCQQDVSNLTDFASCQVLDLSD